MNDAGKQPVPRRALAALRRLVLGLTCGGQESGGSRWLISGKDMRSQPRHFGQRRGQIVRRNLIRDAKLDWGKLSKRMRYVAVCLGYW